MRCEDWFKRLKNLEHNPKQETIRNHKNEISKSCLWHVIIDLQATLSDCTIRAAFELRIYWGLVGRGCFWGDSIRWFDGCAKVLPWTAKVIRWWAVLSWWLVVTLGFLWRFYGFWLMMKFFVHDILWRFVVGVGSCDGSTWGLFCDYWLRALVSCLCCGALKQLSFRPFVLFCWFLDSFDGFWVFWFLIFSALAFQVVVFKAVFSSCSLIIVIPAIFCPIRKVK